MIWLNSLCELTGCEIYAKCEFLNPGGGVKDRMSKQAVLNALKSGKLKKGGTIYEGTVGSTGISLSMIGRSLKLKTTIVMPND